MKQYFLFLSLTLIASNACADDIAIQDSESSESKIDVVSSGDEMQAAIESFIDSTTQIAEGSKQMLLASQVIAHQCIQQIIQKTELAKDLFKPTSEQMIEDSKQKLVLFGKQIKGFFKRWGQRTMNAAQAFTAPLEPEETSVQAGDQ